MRNPVLLLLSFLILVPCTVVAADSRVTLTLDSSEADQVLAIQALRAAGHPIDDAQWQKLFATEPYQRLKVREAAIAKRFNAPENELKDEDFKKFVTSDDLLKRASELRATLARWKQADLQETGQRVLQYLPASATIRARIYP